jgi:hypothetical protein
MAKTYLALAKEDKAGRPIVLGALATPKPG